MTNIFFYTNISVHYAMLVGVIFSIAYPSKRIWPPLKKWSWQYIVTWFLFYAAVTLTIILAFLTWDTWIISSEIRYFIGIPASLIGGVLVSWGIATLGIENTSGSAGGFVEKGPYQFTRNPQYLGDITLFLGLALVANSLYVAILLILQSIIFAITPLTEELWLEEQYGDDYIEYKSRTPRFL
jgi:protein-S-isoprenylcysteine O-methyltransferase Ste14